jgi:hypothetical protein
MEGGDLGAWEGQALVVVLEGVLCTPSWEGRLRRHLIDSEQWGWQIVGVRTIQRYAFNSVPVEVVTFLSPEVADHAAAWFNRYDVEVASVEPVEFNAFARSLAWRIGRVMKVVDSVPDRLARYGQLGFQAQLGGEF